MISALALYKSFTPARMAAGEAQFAKTGTMKSEVAYFKAKAAKVTSVDEFLKDYRVLKFITRAYDMDSQLQYPARLRTILKDDASDPKALVNRMNDASYREVNKAFDFFKSGTAKLKDAAFITSVVEKYTDTSYEQSLGTMNPALTEALYFKKRIGSVKYGYEIIGDKALWKVVRTAFNLPQNAVQGDLTMLSRKIEKLVGLDKVKDSAYVEKITQRFLALADVEQMKSQSSPMLDMFI